MPDRAIARMANQKTTVGVERHPVRPRVSAGKIEEYADLCRAAAAAKNPLAAAFKKVGGKKPGGRKSLLELGAEEEGDEVRLLTKSSKS